MGIGGTVHVSCTAVVLLSVRVVNMLQASCHCSPVSWLVVSICVSSSIWSECLSKKVV